MILPPVRDDAAWLAERAARADWWQGAALEMRQERDELYRSLFRVFFCGFACGMGVTLLVAYGDMVNWW